MRIPMTVSRPSSKPQWGGIIPACGSPERKSRRTQAVVRNEPNFSSWTEPQAAHGAPAAIHALGDSIAGAVPPRSERHRRQYQTLLPGRSFWSLNLTWR